jgi:gamma-D-glutamyl-L-lysine dipeptidyl-peptidase
MNQYGICHLSYFPLRKEASHKSENLTVVLFGEVFEIIQTEGNWFYIKTAFDNYNGWITSNELRLISKETFDKINSAPKFYSAELFQQATAAVNRIMIGFGSPLPLWNGSFFSIGDENFGIEGKVIEAKKRERKEVIELASIMLDFPYLWGGKNTFGLDCSGLVQTVYKICGISLPRDAWQQELIGSVISLKDADTADLAFFKDEQGKVTHVGIVYNNNFILHASGKVRIDSLDEHGIYNKDINDYTHMLKGLKRVM